MRIAYLTQSYPPMISGAAHVAHQIAQGMAQRGHKVLVIAASDHGNPYLTKNGQLTVLRLASFRNPVRVGQRFLFYPYRDVMGALREFQPEVIHAHEPLQIGLLGIRYAKHAHIPIVLTVHQLPRFVASYLPGVFKDWVEIPLWMYARWLSRKFTSIITPSRTTSALVQGITGGQINTIGCGLDLQTFRPPLPCDDEAATRQKWDLPADVPLLLHVGRLDADKRVDRVIHAAARTMVANNAHLIVVGDGIQKPALMELCQSLGITDRVHFTGYISTSQGLPEIYRMAQLFVTASEIETQGIVLLEAAASGLPIVAVRATCIPEIVYDGINGFLAESGDLIGLSNTMDLLLRDRDKALRMGRAGRTLAEQHALDSTLDAHETLYLHLHQHGRLTHPNWHIRKTRSRLKRATIRMRFMK